MLFIFKEMRGIDMDDSQLLQNIEKLVNEEHALMKQAEDGQAELLN